MNRTSIGIKLKEVYLPFFVVSVGTILFYNLFRWTFDIKFAVLPFKEDLLNFWIPSALSWVVILIWLRRRIRVLNIRGERDKGYFGYQFVMVVAVAAPIIVSQNYIEKASFDLVSVNTAYEAKNKGDEKYFDIRSFSINENASLPYITARSSGRNNDNLNFYLYLACPFENSENLWYGVEYSKKLSNRISDSKKDSEYRSFLEKSEKEFNTYNFQKVEYFEKLGYSDDRDGFIEAIKRRYPNVKESEQVILVPRYGVFEDRLGNTLPWIFGSFGIGAFVLLLMVVIPKIDENGLEDFRKKKPPIDEDLEYILEFLDPRGPNKATALLILLNIAVFVVMILAGLNILSPTPKELLEIGGNRRFEVMNGEYWRLFTSNLFTMDLCTCL
jgi:rhomboid protease GluP